MAFGTRWVVVVQTSLTFGIRWVVVIQTPLVHWGGGGGSIHSIRPLSYHWANFICDFSSTNHSGQKSLYIQNKSLSAVYPPMPTRSIQKLECSQMLSIHSLLSNVQF